MVVGVDDAYLVAAARRGDLEAFEVLVRRHEAWVFRLALRMTASPADAEEAAQDAFVQAWRSLHLYREDATFRTWLARIVTNRCLDLVAARRLASELPENLEDTRGDLAAQAEGRERLRALTGAILALPPDARAALVLREFQGLSYAEVAEVLDVSLAAVKGRIHRARLDLAAMMEGWR